MRFSPNGGGLRRIVWLGVLVIAATGCSGPSGPDAAVPAILTFEVTAVSGTAANPVSPTPSALVRNENLVPIANVEVTFAVTSGGGAVTGATATTNANGVAAVGSWTLGPLPGENILTATAGNLSRQLSVKATPQLKQIAVGYEHACALSQQGEAYCWGNNQGGALGVGTNVNSSRPVHAASGLSFTQIAVGAAHSCGLTSGGTVHCWGKNQSGQLGSAGPDATNPRAVTGQSFSSIVAADFHTCGLTSGGQAHCWGSGSRLGNGGTSNSVTPVAVSGGLSFSKLFAGQSHTCGVTAASKAYCWGDNSSGALGDSSLTGGLVPVAVQGAATYQSLAAGAVHTCGTTTAGVVQCWGSYLQNVQSTYPVTVHSTPLVTVLAAGRLTTCGIATTGLFCWGSPWIAGSGGSTPILPPGALISATAPLVSVSMREFNACALSAGGTGFCWGDNLSGQVGNGKTLGSVATPTALDWP